MTTLLKDDEWGKWSDVEIAQRCSVGKTMVGKIREVIFPKRQDSPPRKVRRGNTEYTMDTSKIGRRNMTTPTYCLPVTIGQHVQSSRPVGS